MSKLTLIRHGSTGLNGSTAEDKIRGWKDVPLAEKGIEEAHKLADSLMTSDIDLLISSDLSRATKTAEIVSQKTGIPFEDVSKNLRPWNVGEFTGRLTKEILPELQEYIKHPERIVPGGESFDKFKERFLNELETIIKDNPGKHVAVVAHHRNERVLKGWADKGFPQNKDINDQALMEKGAAPATATEYNIKNTDKIQPDKKREIDGIVGMIKGEPKKKSSIKDIFSDDFGKHLSEEMKGETPDHEWQGTSLMFEKPDATWGESVDLKGEKGDKGDSIKGDKGDSIKGETGERGSKFIGTFDTPKDLPEIDDINVKKGDWAYIGQTGEIWYT